ncbi:hypothetical protein [Ensifer sp. SL37]|uniref:hypothetical protein n=1 Tax=Ensifer sp. SL37 TaxID=2995137 RepID=UPI0022731C04|nr:hypothetical protein [Ensifer sp. SL37]MCY1745026.1 hypothetical protein [Ensifer sp. SL37]
MRLNAVCVTSALFAMTAPLQASTVSEREYKRGYEDCSRGDYDQNQHGASYKRGCRAAEDVMKSGAAPKASKAADQGHMKSVCDGAVTGRFNPHVRSVNISNVEHQNFGWGVYGMAVLDDGSTSDFVCMFSTSGKFKRVNVSEPIGASNQMDHEGYCPPDVTEADRYKYPACD